MPRTEAGRTGRGLCRLQERGDNGYGQGGSGAEGENRVGARRIPKAETTDVGGALGPVSTRRKTGLQYRGCSAFGSHRTILYPQSL